MSEHGNGYSGSHGRQEITELQERLQAPEEGLCATKLVTRGPLSTFHHYMSVSSISRHLGPENISCPVGCIKPHYFECSNLPFLWDDSSCSSSRLLANVVSQTDYLWAYSPFIGLWPRFQFLGPIHSREDSLGGEQPVARPLPTYRTTREDSLGGEQPVARPLPTYRTTWI
jgi:hypothetical protein